MREIGTAMWELVRRFTPWRRKETDTEALYRYLWSQDGKPLKSGTLTFNEDRQVKIIDGKITH